MNVADNVVISLFVLGVMLLAWLAFKGVALAFGWIMARGRRNVSQNKRERER